MYACQMRGAKVSDKEPDTTGRAATQRKETSGVPTTTRFPFQSAVLSDWSLVGGLPGRTARMEAVGSEVGRSLRSESSYTIARSKKVFLAVNYLVKEGR